MFTAVAVVETMHYGVRRTAWAGLFNGFQSAVGLLLLSLVSPAALPTSGRGVASSCCWPLPSRHAAWYSASGGAYYRGVPALALLPTLVALGHAVPSGRWIGVPLVYATVLAQGAAITSLGMALATWFARVERALILSAAASILVTVAWIPFVAVVFRSSDVSLGLAAASPFLGIGILTNSILQSSVADWNTRVGWCQFWIVAYSVASVCLLVAALASFDRCMGRTGSRPPRRSQPRGPCGRPRGQPVAHSG